MKQDYANRHLSGGSGLTGAIHRIAHGTATWFSGAKRVAGLAEDRRMQSAIAELQRFEDYELADIGLTRGDLTPEGLRVAGEKRAAAQSLLSTSNVRGVA